MAEPKPPPPLYGRLFPDASGLFSADYSRISDVIDHCIVVLDTSAMLVPFSTGKESLAQIRQTYEKLVSDKRLVVPGQVAREFAVNRPTKLGELYHAISLKQDIPGPKAGNYPLLDASTSYSTIQRLEGEITKLLKEYRAAVSDLLSEIQSWTWDDPVSAIYRDVLTPDTVHDPQFDDERVHARWVESVREKVPPGYKDATKEVNADGDLRVWLTILDLAEARMFWLSWNGTAPGLVEGAGARTAHEQEDTSSPHP